MKENDVIENGSSVMIEIGFMILFERVHEKRISLGERSK